MTTDKLPIIIDENLRLRWAEPADNDQLIALAFQVLDEGEDKRPFVKTYLEDWVAGKFPILKHDDMTVVEDTKTGKIVSSMCLFSHTWHYATAPIKVGRPEIVMTHPDYQRRGLIRAQFDVIHALSAKRKEVMQVITGIPSFYRKFGYELCLDLGSGYHIFPSRFPKLLDEYEDDFRLRTPESQSDREFVKTLHKTNTRSMLFSMDIPEEIWQFEFGDLTDGSDGKFHWLIIEDKSGTPVGYLHHDHIFWGSEMDINFLALLPGIGYLNLLPNLIRQLWHIAQRKFADDSFEHPIEEVRCLYLHLGRQHPIYDAFGRNFMLKANPYAWYVRIPDEVAYLNAVKSQLEDHLANSTACRGYSGDIRINLYDRGIRMNFQDGAIKIAPWQPATGLDSHAHFPESTFWSLLCGHKSASQLAESIPDCWMTRNTRVLLDTLFPEFTGLIWVAGGGG